MKELGEKLIGIRKSKGLSQEALAEKANISLRTIQRIENNESEPRGHTLTAICEALNINIEELVEYGKIEDKTFLIGFHLSVMLGTLVPFILWIVKKDSVIGLNKQGKNLLLFRVLYLFSIFILISVLLALNMYKYNLFNPDYFSKILIIAFYVNIIVSYIYPILIALYIWRTGKLKKFYPPFFK